MKKSNDTKTQKFIDSIKVIDNKKYLILQKLREIVFDNYPQVKERMMYGGIMLSLDDDIGGLFVYEKHISFEFGNGYIFEDKDNLLEGKGKYRRHLKLRSLEDIITKRVEFFVKQASEIES